MPMCTVVTRDVEGRYRGFLGSVMLELAPGTYAHPRISKRVRDQIWSVLAGWHGQLQRGSLLMTWADREVAGGLGVRTLGTPPKDVVEHEGILLIRRDLSGSSKSASATAPQD